MVGTSAPVIHSGSRPGTVPPMILVGLTGGIGAGKSMVSALLAAHGAVIIDADAITRDLQEPGQPVLAAIVERFGAGVLSADGRLDRAALADIVFPDPDALRDLNAIVHPAVGAEIARRIAAEHGSNRLVVLDVPLLVETRRGGLSGIVVVDVPTETAVDRLVNQRGMTEAAARARVAVQASREERLAKADVVVDNSGTREALEARVAEVWEWMQGLPPAEMTSETGGSVPPPR
jgi:dephospho-CoA kinase